MSHTYPDPIQGPNSPFAKSFSYEPMPHCPQFVFNQVELRDYFAAAALQGILSGADRSTVKYLENMRYPAGEMSSAAYNIADAMIKAREAKP